MKSLKLSVVIGIIFALLLGLFLLIKEDVAPAVKTSHYYTQGSIIIESVSHRERNIFDTKFFTKYEGDFFGLTEHNNFSVLELTIPFLYGRGISSGDFNNDGWQDIVLATSKGILLYRNLRTNKFVLEDINIPKINNLGIHIVAFVDINNDGWQDIYVTSYEGKNYFILNDKGKFQRPTFLEVFNKKAVLTEAVSFGDIDKNGDLDFVHGNWIYALAKSLPTEGDIEVNQIVMNRELQFVAKNLQEITGETLSILLSDFTNDNNLDLIVGNDFNEPDIFYTGKVDGRFIKILKIDNVIPISGTHTMSVDVADFNNDLYADIYIAARGSEGQTIEKSFCFEIQNSKEKEKCEEKILTMEAIYQNRDVEKCIDIAGHQNKNACAVMIALYLAEIQNDETICQSIPEDYSIHRIGCHNYFAPRVNEDQVDYSKNISQKNHGNILLRGSYEGIFKNVATETGVGEGYWSWNAKFADLDNDEWQDIYVANGFIYPSSDVRSNIFFHNYEGQYFTAEQEEFGLENYNAIHAYTYIDIDNDGDLDIITVAVNGPLNIYINNETKNNSITFEFRDKIGNHFGIGNKVYIYYGENNERHQVREIKAGGGFLSFDSPIAHFGLGKYDRVNKVEIVWSTGEKTTIDKEFLANKNYVVIREFK